jgi:hypothetical protein
METIASRHLIQVTRNSTNTVQAIKFAQATVVICQMATAINSNIRIPSKTRDREIHKIRIRSKIIMHQTANNPAATTILVARAIPVALKTRPTRMIPVALTILVAQAVLMTLVVPVALATPVALVVLVALAVPVTLAAGEVVEKVNISLMI